MGHVALANMCPLAEFEGRLQLLHKAEYDSQVAGISSDSSSRENEINLLQLRNSLLIV